MTTGAVERDGARTIAVRCDDGDDHRHDDNDYHHDDDKDQCQRVTTVAVTTKIIDATERRPTPKQ